MSAVCASCDEGCQVPAEHWVGIDQLMVLAGMDEIQVGLAMRVGTLPLPRAVGPHGEPRWFAADVEAFVTRRARK